MNKRIFYFIFFCIGGLLLFLGLGDRPADAIFKVIVLLLLYLLVETNIYKLLQ